MGGWASSVLVQSQRPACPGSEHGMGLGGWGCWDNREGLHPFLGLLHPK